MDKKNILTYEGLKKLEDELQDLKVNKRREIAQKIKEAREQGDLSENAEYDAAKDEQRDIEARIEEIEKILKNAEVGSIEMLLSDSVSVAAKARSQGVKVRLSIYEGMFHVFQMAYLNIPESKKAWAEAGKFIDVLRSDHRL